MLAIYLSMVDNDEQRDKLEMIYRKYYGMMYSEAMAVMKDPQRAEDTVHDTMLYLIQNIDNVRVEDRRELIAYLRLVVRHKALDAIKRTQKENIVDKEDMEDIPTGKADDPETVVIDASTLERCIGILEKMDVRYRNPLILQMKGYKAPEIASMLHTTPQAVRVQIHRARKMILAGLEGK